MTKPIHFDHADKGWLHEDPYAKGILGAVVLGVFLAFAVFLLSACTETAAETNKKTLSGLNGIERSYDEEYGVACYRYRSYRISCVKVKP